MHHTALGKSTVWLETLIGLVSFFTFVNPNSKKMITEDKPKRTSICFNDSNDSSSCGALPTEDSQLLKNILAAIFIIIFVATGIVVFIWR